MKISNSLIYLYISLGSSSSSRNSFLSNVNVNAFTFQHPGVVLLGRRLANSKRLVQSLNLNNRIFQEQQVGGEDGGNDNDVATVHQQQSLANAKVSISSLNDDDNSSSSPLDWKKQWYPVLPTNYLNDASLALDTTPMAITILNQDLVLWKPKIIKNQSSTFSILNDSCPHRRAPLSIGKIYNDTLACRYHGWEFNTQGSCTHIPMMPDMTKEDDDNTNVNEKKKESKKLLSKAFCVKSYSTQVQDGLLWVYMDPTQDINKLPPLPITSPSDDDDNNNMWSVTANLISWQSMIENSFDPSHAPFAHEGPAFGGGSFSANMAIPISKFDVISTTSTQDNNSMISKSGFTVQHTDYQSLRPGAKPLVTTRQFTAPSTTQTDSAFFSATIHFIPTKNGECLTISKFQTGGSNNVKNSKKKKKIKMPKKLKDFLQDSIHFRLLTTRDDSIRFLYQDRLIMQGQDMRKSAKNTSNNIMNKKWNDMYPTRSDVGVQSMQKWMKKFGKQPGFCMPSNHEYLNNNSNRQLSLWDRHAKYCTKCRRSITRIGRVASKGMLVSNASLGFSGLLLVGVLGSFLVKQQQHTSALMILSSSLFFLILSVASRFLVHYCSTLLERVFCNPRNLVKYQQMEVYAK